jgi:hypothetical protein
MQRESSQVDSFRALRMRSLRVNSCTRVHKAAHIHRFFLFLATFCGWGAALCSAAVPRVFVLSPAFNARLDGSTGNEVEFTVRAVDDGTVVRVVVEAPEGTATAGSQIDGTQIGPRDWRVRIPVRAGLNSTRVYAFDNQGGQSIPVRWQFTFVKRLPIAVSVAGSGLIFPTSGEFEAGRRTRFFPRPGRGQVLAKWSILRTINGLPETIEQTAPVGARFVDIQFEDGDSAVQFEYIGNPFLNRSGFYTGVIYGSQLLELSSGGTNRLTVAVGTMTVLVAPGGAFSGTLLLKGRVRRFAGVFDGQGEAERIIPLAGGDTAALRLALDFSAARPVLDVEIMDPEDLLTVSLGRLQGAPMFSRQHTVAFQPDPLNSLFSGSGYAIVVHAGGGVFRMAGAAPSGERFSTVGYFDGSLTEGVGVPEGSTTPGGTAGVSFFAFIPNSRADFFSSNRSFGGTMDVGYGSTPLIGGLARSQSGVFGDQLDINGARYTVPPVGTVTEPLLSSTSEPYQFTVDAPGADGLFTAPSLVKAFGVDALGRIRLASPGPDRLAFFPDPRTGIFSGRYFDANNNVQPVAGVLIQENANEYLGIGASGENRVRLIVAPLP